MPIDGLPRLLPGPLLAGAVVGEPSRPPTVRELIALKRAVEHHGPSMTALLASVIEASGQSPAVRIETQLNRLLELDPALWTHPSHVLERPHSDVAELLGASRIRMESAGEEEKARLVGVEEKLERAVRIEDRARERRAKRANKK